MDEEDGPRQRAAETKRRRTRESILNGTLDLYGRESTGDFTLDQIGDAAGVSAATIANHFRSKYDALKAAYDRLLSPVIDTIVNASKAGVYKPTDGVDELIRYVYSVAKLSHDHRALTTSMLRAYFDVPPEQNRELYPSTSNYPYDFIRSDRVPAGGIAMGMFLILQLPPLTTNVLASIRTFGSRRDMSTALYHSEALLMGLYQDPSEHAPSWMTEMVCREVLAATVREELNTADIDARTERIKQAVHTSGIIDAFMGDGR